MAKCPSCNAPLMHYNNSDGSSTDYCEYCNYRHDFPAPETSLGKHISGMVGNFVGEVFGVSVNDKKQLSPIEIMDAEKREREMLNKMTDKERRLYERQKALEKRREEAIRRSRR